MSIRYKGSILSSTAKIPTRSAAKGIWKNATILQAQKAGIWPGLYVPIDATYLVVAGGGAGGNYYYGGGGGAGGLLTNNGGTVFTVPVASGAYAVIVGTGGIGSDTTPTNGNTSSLIGTGLSISAVGGGHGGNIGNANPPTSGGSGGGGGSQSGVAPGGAGTIGQGCAGGNGTGTAGYGGGGGGSGGIGTSGTGTTNPAGTGGIGTNLASLISTTLATSSGVGYVTGAQVQFAGGGGGGRDGNLGGGGDIAPGSAGGGNGAIYTAGNLPGAGQAYTGSGGGGACHTGTNNSVSGSGGKGVVIIKYPSNVALATGGDIIDISGGYVTHIFKTMDHLHQYK